ncbi:MAG: bifunctional adenosylcobinamide kinase/adenosylcobinamide-phosphate guanylyltransferase [Caldimicrobium sp.]
MIVFVLGGAKSGKTKWALNYAQSLKNMEKYIYLATALPIDKEMEEKILRHKEEREELWHTIEEPLNLAQRIREIKGNSFVILIDCLTLWCSNLLYYSKKVKDHLEELLKEIEHFKKNNDSHLIFVSNEVGMSLVPENPLGREFRELLGWINQEIAKRSDEVYFILAGLSLKLKG